MRIVIYTSYQISFRWSIKGGDMHWERGIPIV